MTTAAGVPFVPPLPHDPACRRCGHSGPHHYLPCDACGCIDPVVGYATDARPGDE